MAAEKHHGEMFHLVHASGQERWSKAAERKLKTRQTLDSTSKGSWDLVTIRLIIHLITYLLQVGQSYSLLLSLMILQVDL